MADQQYCLRWNNHQNTLISVFDSLQERGCMVDCTLGAEGQSLQAHKVVLSACSPYLEDLLTKHYDKHPILILKDVRFEELKAMVDYMYRGEVNVAHDKLNLFLRAAESLQIKGLSDSGTDPPDTGGTAGGTKRTSKGAPVSVRSNQQLTVRSTNLADDSRDGSVSPSQRKRRRRRGSDESDNDSSSNVADGKQSSAAAAPVTGPSVLNQDLLPTVPASVPADALLSSIMESAETDTATDSGLYANAVTPSSQENVILDKGSSDVLVQPKTEYLDDDTQDLALGDDDSVAGPSHSRSGNFMNDTDMFMADQDGSNNAQGPVKAEDGPERPVPGGEDCGGDGGAALEGSSAAQTQPLLVISETFSLAGPAGGAGQQEQASRQQPGRDTRQPFKCAECGKKFRAEADLRKHLVGHSKPRRHSCEECGKEFLQRDHLMKHTMTHTGEKPHDCDVCGKKFSRNNHLTEHKRIHTGDKPHECDICGTKFIKSSDLTRHKRIHTGEKSHECDICRAKFIRSGDLTVHKRIHTGEKPYKCNACGKKFTQRGHLLVHKRIHSGQKP